MSMSDKKTTTQECVMLIAYLNYIKTPKVHRVSIEKDSYNEKVKLVLSDKPHRPEPVRNRSKKPKYTLDDLLSQMPEYEEFFEAVKSGKLKPHRPEPVRNRSKKPEYTLDDLLAELTDDNRHEEVGTGRAVGNEEW